MTRASSPPLSARCGRAILAVALSGLAVPAWAAQTEWYSVLQDGRCVGLVQWQQDLNAAGSTERETLQLAVTQGPLRTPMTRNVSVERDTTGAVTALRFSLEGGAAALDWHAPVHNQEMLLPAAAARAPHDIAIRLSGEPMWLSQRGALAGLDAAGSPRRYVQFDPVSLSQVEIEAHVDPALRRDDALGVVIARKDTSETRDETAWIDPKGALLELHTRLLDTDVTIVRCRGECPPSIETGIDAMKHLVVRSPVHISPTLLHERLRYVLSSALPGPLHVPATAEQSVVNDGERAVVTVCADCGLEDAPTPAALQRYTAANAWVRSDAPEIRALALGTVDAGKPLHTRMLALAHAVTRKMRGTISFMGYADALQALHSGAGDCTEYAVLLAALARAQGIPARVVSGLAYASRFSGKKDVFSPHMWVQAWDGSRWKSYDAALDGFDSTHIVLAIGDGLPQQYDDAVKQLPRLRMEKAGVVRAP